MARWRAKSRWMVGVVAVVAVALLATGAMRDSGNGRAAPADASLATGIPADVRTEDVVIGQGEAALAGTLVLPAHAGRAAAVVVVSGSGPNGRHGRIRGFPAYGTIAGHLARSGTAVLLLDRRGVGGSAGNWKHERIEDRADDTLTAVQWLRQRADVDPGRVGVLGHSQGGWVAELAAARSRDVAFVVLMAGPGESVQAQVLTDERNEWLRTGRSPEEAQEHADSVGRWLALADAVAPACRLGRLHPICYTVEYDAAPALRSIHVPVLALFGELDTMVPPEPNRALIADGLRQAGNPGLTVRVFAGANHQFWAARTGARAEYAQLEPGYVPGFLDTIGDWIASVPVQKRG